MRFCQVDGTPLVDDAPAFDPYATIVAPSAPVIITPVEDVSVSAPVGMSDEPIAEPDELLDLPAADPLKTMYVSEDEMRAALGQPAEVEEQIMEVPPLAEPEPPAFVRDELPTPMFGDVPPPASPFAVTESAVDVPSEPELPFQSTNPPIPSPFDIPELPAYETPTPETEYSEPATMIQMDPPPSPFQTPEPSFTPAPETPQFVEPEPVTPSFGSPFEPIAAAPMEWTPPPAPESSWQNQDIGQNTPFQPPVAGAEGANKTLATVSLVCGILSILCCGFLTGIPAIITGYMAKNNVDSNPQEYGGRGFAIAGMVLGAISLVLTVVVVILQIFLGVLGNI